MRTNRVIYSDDGTLYDLTTNLSNYHAGSYTFSGFVAADDYLYIGSIVPFNHFYLKMGTASVASTATTIEYWSGNDWYEVVELIDETSGLTQDGYITFVPDRNYKWVRSDTNGTGQQVTGLTSITIYDKYWIRISFSNDLTADCIISWLGQIFSNDNDFGSEYPDLVRSSVLTAFESGKTSWEEQHVRAAEIIVRDLISKNVIFARGQILERNSFMLASISKVAELIFNSFGDDYIDQKKNARNEYDDRIDASIYDIDSNLDGELSESEMTNRQGFLKR